MTPSLRQNSVLLSSCAQKIHNRPPQIRAFTSSPPCNVRNTVCRRRAYGWLRTQGKNFYDNPLPGSPNYISSYDMETGQRKLAEGDDKHNPKPLISNRPFPQNQFFISQSVLSDKCREAIWQAVMLKDHSVRDASMKFRVDMRRVGAVVRLKEIEKQWGKKGKWLSRPLTDAIHSMVPLHDFERAHKPFESINDLPVHPHTTQQIWHSTTESRHFTRVDAAKVFDEKLLPADERIPHPQMIEMRKDVMQGMGPEELAQRRDMRRQAEMKKNISVMETRAKRERKIRVVENSRWQFRISEVNVDDVGADGRGVKATGWRYGNPLSQKLDAKIPKRVG